MHTTNGDAWLRVSTSRFVFHDCVNGVFGAIVWVTVLVFIGSLNVTTIACAIGTSNAESAGFVVTT